jgi:uncharacterized Ntn-hydrolase superfamily protein
MTFSIAGLCPRTGEIGLALTTSSMAVGARTLRLVPGRGAVFAQARSDPRLAARAAASLEAGRTAHEALDELLATPDIAWRQLAVLDLAGDAAHFTGDGCMPAKGAVDAPGAVALGNALASDAVVPTILRGFFADPAAPLGERLLQALEHGLVAGGEPYPLRSAALQLGRPGIPFAVVDLRVDLHNAPLAALRHLWVNYTPLLEGYLTRAIHPANAPPAASFEGFLRNPVEGPT